MRAYGSESYAKRHDFMYLYFKIALLAGNPLQVGGRERGVCVCVWGGGRVYFWSGIDIQMIYVHFVCFNRR